MTNAKTINAMTWNCVRLDFSEQSVREAIFRLRRQVYAEVTRMKDYQLEVLDDSANHFGIWHEASLIASIRVDKFDVFENIPYLEIIKHLDFSEYEKPFGCVRRLVVMSDFRRQGIAKALLQCGIDSARMSEIKTLLGVSISEPIGKQMKALGFKLLGRSRPITSGPYRGIDYLPEVLVMQTR